MTALTERARSLGVHLSYRDNQGEIQRAPKATLEAIVDALGSDEPSTDVIVAWDGRHPDLDETLPLGYHERGETLVISAPTRAPSHDARRWGVFLPLYALHSDRSFGIGDLTDLEALLSWTCKLGGNFVATLPLFATLPEDPSPYSPISRLFYDEVYVDPQRTPEWEDCAPARELARSRGFRSATAKLLKTDLVDHEAVRAHKRRVLELLAETFRSSGAKRLRAFTKAEPLARDYAAFRAKREGLNSEKYHLYAQLVAHEQLSALASAHPDGGLLLDLPVGVRGDGFDAEHFDVFANGISVGAPPDDLGPLGQNWGFPPLHPLRSRADGHTYFRRLIEKLMRSAHTVRIDHVMGLHRLYWIPDGMDGSQGAYVGYPADELYAICTLEATRAGTTLVGEDLGTVPQQVRTHMRRHNIAGTFVAQFETHDDPKAAMGTPSMTAHACVNTHDTATFAAFWDGLSAKHRRTIARFLGVKGGDATDVLPALLGWLAASPAPALNVTLEDLWGEVHPQNVPGTSGEGTTNWRRRAQLPLERIVADGQIASVLGDIARSRRNDEETS